MITIHTTRVWADQNHLEHGADPMFAPFKGPAHKDHHTIPGEDKMRALCLLTLVVEHLPLCLWGGRVLNGSQLALLWFSRAQSFVL